MEGGDPAAQRRRKDKGHVVFIRGLPCGSTEDFLRKDFVVLGVLEIPLLEKVYCFFGFLVVGCLVLCIQSFKYRIG